MISPASAASTGNISAERKGCDEFRQNRGEVAKESRRTFVHPIEFAPVFVGYLASVSRV